MRRETAIALLAVTAWAPALLLIYRSEVLECEAAAARWGTLLSAPGRQRYNLYLRDEHEREAFLGVLTHELVLEETRAHLHTSLAGGGEVTVRLSTVVSKQSGFISANGLMNLFGREIRLRAERTGDIVAIEIQYPGGGMTYRAPVSMVSPESAAAISTALPFRDMPGLYPGMRWRGLLFDFATCKLRPAEVVVSRFPAEALYRGQPVHALEASVTGFSGYRAWYLADGRVLKQSVRAGKGSIIVERLLDEK